MCRPAAALKRSVLYIRRNYFAEVTYRSQCYGRYMVLICCIRISALLICFLVIQLQDRYCLLPYIWLIMESLFIYQLLFYTKVISNVIIVRQVS
jgi:hypothetical protein